MKGYMYILKCSDGSYYTGSTKDLKRRFQEHELGEGAEFTKKRLPVSLVYFEEFERIDEAFEREKQIQRWSRKKKEALIKGDIKGLKRASECKNETHFQRTKAKSEHKTERSRGLKQTSEDLGP